MRVLHYLELASRLDRSGIGTAVDNQRLALDRTDIEVVRAPRNASPCFRDPLADIDLVHCSMIGPGSLALAETARRTDTPLLLHAHVTAEDFAGSFRGSRLVAGPLRAYLCRFYSRADLLLCPSHDTRDVLRSYPVDTPIYPLTNGVDVDRFAGFEELRDGYRERLDLSGTVVATVGNVFERKGLSTFCELARATDYEFAWFGSHDRGLLASGPVRRWTEDPPDNVTFTGWIEDVRGAYAAGDVFLFPTRVENQGIAVLEAMACGKPVVLRRLPVFEEYYTDGLDCLMCETRREFRSALDRLAGSPDLRTRLGENAAETARDHDIDTLAQALVPVYEAVAGGRVDRLDGV